MNIFDAITQRRDTRHFTNREVPQQVLDLALKCAQQSPSVGLTEPARFIFIKDLEQRRLIKELFVKQNRIVLEQLKDDSVKLAKYTSLKLEAITDTPLGMVVCADHSVLDQFTIGTTFTVETLDWSVCCAIQNFWLALTAQKYSMGWISIVDFNALSVLLNLPPTYKVLGYFNIGEPATDYDGKPMLEQLEWKKSIYP